MVLGQYRVRLGEKNRIAFPKRFREELGDTLIITSGFEKSLLVVGQKSWNEFVKEWNEKSYLIPEVRDIRRFLFGGATEVTLDQQGRFVLPSNLIEFSHIKNEVVFVGASNNVEVWDATIWEEYQELMRLQIRENAKKLVEQLEKAT